MTLCGGGAPAAVPWALARGDELGHPVALYQVTVLAVGLILAAEWLPVVGRVVVVGLGAMTFSQLIGRVWGGSGADGLVALVLAGATLWLAMRGTRRKPLTEPSLSRA